MRVCLAAALLCSWIMPVMAAEPIKIGDMNSITGEPEYAAAYYEGAALAVEQINKGGGVLGHPIEILKRDDKGDPAEATRLANELLDRDHVAMFAGTWLDDVNLAVSNVAKQRKTLYLKTGDGTDKYIWQEGHQYGFRIFPTNRVLAAVMAEEAAKTGAKRWAIVAPNYEYGHDIARNFKEELKKRKPDVQFVVEQYPETFKANGNLIVRVLKKARPEGVFNATFGPDTVNIVRAGKKVGFFDNKPVLSPALGLPEYYPTYGNEYPLDWIVTGYDPDAVHTKEHDAWVKAFKQKYGAKHDIKFGALSGYVTYQIIAQMIEKTGATETEAMVTTLHKNTFKTAVGDIHFRSIDNQSNAGEWVGRTTIVNGKPALKDVRYFDGEKYMPSDAWIKKQRGEK